MNQETINTNRPRDRGAFGCHEDRRTNAGMTLIELTLVLFIIGILATITIGVTQSVVERGRVARARVEMAAISAALEKYKAQYGDFPRTGVPANFTPRTAAEGGTAVTTAMPESQLFNALFGVLAPGLTTLAKRNDAGAEVIGLTFLDPEEFTFENTDAAGEPLLPTTARTQVANAFLDPWGRRYQYAYMSAVGETDWNPSFVLFSAGPDGVADVVVNATDGTASLAADRDDLIANR